MFNFVMVAKDSPERPPGKKKLPAVLQTLYFPRAALTYPVAGPYLQLNASTLSEGKVGWLM